jgi:CCR4-NOT transcription complex subunit 1
MVSFAQPLLWQIRYLITGLSKKNFKSSVAELHQLITLYGYDAQLFFLRTLIEEIELRDFTKSGKDQLKAQLLQTELLTLVSDGQLGDGTGMLLCQALEGSREPQPGVSEDFASHLCRATKLSLPQQLSLAVSFLESGNDFTRREGFKFLRARLREYTAPGTRPPKLTESTLHGVCRALKSAESAEVQDWDEKDQEALLKSLLELHPDVDLTAGTLSGLPQVQRLQQKGMSMKGMVFERKAFGDTPQLLGSASTRMCDILEELGSAASSQDFGEIMDLFLPDVSNEELAQVLAMMIRTGAGRVAHGMDGALNAGLFATARRGQWNDPSVPSYEQVHGMEFKPGSSWDIKGFVSIARNRCPHSNWTSILGMVFDQPGVVVPDQKRFEAVLGIFDKQQFPLEVLLKPRRNGSAQLQFLKRAIEALPNVLTFETSPRLVDALAGIQDTPSGPNR